MLSKKINSIIVFLMVLAANVNAMQITTPYTPGFGARHSQAINIGTSFLAAGGVCLLGACVQEVLEPSSSTSQSSLAFFGLGIGVFTATYFYTEKYNRLQLIDSLLIDPRESIKDIDATRDKFIAEAIGEGLDVEKDISQFTSKYGSLCEKYEQKCPIFLLGECTDANDWFPCVFTRSLNPSYRKKYEERVSKNLVERLVSSKDHINYTSFGCGGALSEMVILTKTLAQKPDACLNIHLIEGDNLCYVAAADYLGTSREITAQQGALDFGDQLVEYVRIVKDKSKSKCDESELQMQLISSCGDRQRKYKQMISLLTKTFPNAQLSLYIHNLTDSYLDYVDKHNCSHADVVTAADIQDEMSVLSRSITDYGKLCAKTLEKKPTSSNVWLAKNGQNNVKIVLYSLADSQGAEKIDLEDGTALYLVTENL